MQKGAAVLFAVGFAVASLGGLPTFAQDPEGTELSAPEEMDLPPPEEPLDEPLGDAGTPPDAPLETDAPPPRPRFVDRTREPRPWPGPFIGLRLGAAGGAGENFLEAGYVPLIAPYLAVEFGYSWRAWGASLHFEGTGLTLPLSGQGEMPQHLMMGINAFYIPSIRLRFLAGLEIIDFYRMTSTALGTTHWWKGFGLRTGLHYRLKDWGEGITPSFFFHAMAHRYPMVEVSMGGFATNQYVDTLAFQGMIGLQVDFQL